MQSIATSFIDGGRRDREEDSVLCHAGNTPVIGQWQHLHWPELSERSFVLCKLIHALVHTEQPARHRHDMHLVQLWFIVTWVTHTHAQTLGFNEQTKLETHVGRLPTHHTAIHSAIHRSVHQCNLSHSTNPHLWPSQPIGTPVTRVVRKVHTTLVLLCNFALKLAAHMEQTCKHSLQPSKLHLDIGYVPPTDTGSLCLAVDSTRTDVPGLFQLLVRRSGTHCQMNSEIRRVMSTAWKGSLKQSCSAFTSAAGPSEVNFNAMRSTDLRFTYLLTY